MWRRILGVGEGYFHFIDDKEVVEIVTHWHANNVDGQIWVKHDVEDMLSKVSYPNVCHLNQGSDYSSNGGKSDVDGIRFDDSEKERTTERNEGFVKVLVDRTAQGSRVKVNGKSLRFKVKARKSKKNSNSSSKVNLFVPAKILGSSSKRNPNNFSREYVDYVSE